jgi:hypothetical protein
MSGPLDRILPTEPFRWLGHRLVVYLCIALIVLQAATGLAGLGQGGEWLIAAVACEGFFIAWLARGHVWSSAKLGDARQIAVRPFAADQRVVATDVGIGPVSVATLSTVESAAIQRMFGAAGNSGVSFLVRGTDREVIGVLLSRDEFELLNAAASVAHDPERMARLLEEPRVAGISLDEAFDGEAM